MDTSIAGRPSQSNDPAHFERWFNAGALIAAATLAGFGLILWIAANWDGFGKWPRFALVFAALGASTLGGLVFLRARVPFALAGFMSIGGLLALIGQTYQTGADAWQLFALWAALALPWALAARNDAMWSAWVIVAFTAIGLWWRSGANWDWVQPPENVLPVWLAAFAVSAALSPIADLRDWLGNTKWAFRLAGVLTALLVLTATLPAILDADGSRILVAAGFAVTVFALAAIVFARPLDVALLAVFAFALDVLIISLVSYPLFFASSHPGETEAFLAIGVLAALLVAGTAKAVLAVQRSATGTVSAESAMAADFAQEHAQTWPVAVMTSIGALIAAVPILVFLGLAFGALMERGPGPYLFGGAILAAALFLLKDSARLSFRQQFGLIALVIALLLIGFGLYRDFPESPASALMLVMCAALAFLVPAGWIEGILGAASAIFAAVIVADLLHRIFGYGYRSDFFESRPAWTLISAAAGLVLLYSDHIAMALTLAARRDGVERFIAGAIAAALAGLIFAAGQTFMLGSWWAGHGGAIASGSPLPFFQFSWLPVLSLLLAAGGCFILHEAYPRLRTPAGYASAALLLVLALIVPGFGAPVLVLGVALVRDRRSLALLAAFAALWLLGSFYYWLGWPLTHKAYLMIGLGTALAAASSFSSAGLPSLDPTARTFPLSRGLAAGLVLMSAAATSVLAAQTIRQKEDILSNGRVMFLELAPADPRSIVQGDYMALRFRIPDNLPTPGAGETEMRVLATLDDRDVATSGRRQSANERPAPNEAVLHLTRRNSGWSLGPNAFFFKEGEGEKYAKARYGEFRAGSGGDVLLTGLADENLQPLK